MSLMKYRDPFAELGLWSHSLFDSFFTEQGGSGALTTRGYPKYDQYNREDGSIVLEFSLAGYKSSELSVTVEGSTLVVSAEKAQKTQDGKRTVSGRSTQSFQKLFTANRNLDLENVKASFEDGLLTVVIPAKSADKPQVKKIEIATLKA